MGSERNAVSIRARAQAGVDNPRPTPLSIGPPTRQGLAALHPGLRVQVLKAVQRQVIGGFAVSYNQLQDIVSWNFDLQVANSQSVVPRKLILYEAAGCPMTVVARLVTSNCYSTYVQRCRCS